MGTVGSREQQLMQSQWIQGDQDNPQGPQHHRMRVVDRDLIRGGHYGQRICFPHEKAEHMAAPTNTFLSEDLSCQPGPSTHGPLADIETAPTGCRL